VVEKRHGDFRDQQQKCIGNTQEAKSVLRSVASIRQLNFSLLVA